MSDYSSQGRTASEKTTLVIASLILVGMVLAVSWLSWRGDEQPARIVVEADTAAIREEEAGFYLPIIVRNDGDTAVSDAVIEGELDTGSGESETAEFTIGFLAGGETEYGVLVFRDDPREAEVTVGVRSYVEP